MSNTNDLTDWGGGVDHDDPNPEDEVNKKITKWIAGQPNTRVYWDRERSYAHGTFSITTRRRPDLLIDTDGNTFVVEVKRGADSSSLYQAAQQAFRYWLDIENGEATYNVNNETKDINAVLLATQFSQSGHLFQNTHRLDPRRPDRRRPDGDDDARGRHYPRVEHASTQTYVRVLHQLGPKLWAEEHDLDPDTGIGALYSSVLDERGSGSSNVTPAAFHIVAQDGRYSQNWDYIPYWKQEQ